MTARGGAVVVIRRATQADAGPVADVYLTSFRGAMPTVRLAHTDDEIAGYLRDVCIAQLETWVAEYSEEGQPLVVAVVVLGARSIEQLYVRPGWQGRGIGSRLLALAKERRPRGFQLFAFQVNEVGRRFYERSGLTVVDMNDGTRNEEHQPDVRYRWTPLSDRAESDSTRIRDQ